MSLQPTLTFDNSYARPPEQFYTRQLPTPVSTPGLIRVNHALACQLEIDPDWLESEAGVHTVAGNRIPKGSDPIATVYAGHQFGGWNPQLGDGRAILLGELMGEDGLRYDFQLKGSGRTPYSRGGDGRSPLGPVLREYIVSEAMAALGVPTTRALAAVTSGDSVVREGELLPGALLARVAQSHIRIGTFQFFAARQNTEALRCLADHVIERHYPGAQQADDPYRAMLDLVVGTQASLVASWQSVGFIHGVMNTDNMLLSGETIDYGPCAFMDAFHPETVYSSIDVGGRYAYRNQPAIAHWNLVQLAQALIPILNDDPDKALASAQEAINAFPDLFLAAYRQSMNKKLGLTGHEEGDEPLVEDLLTLMTEHKADFTLTFRRLSELVHPQAVKGGGLGELIALPDAFAPWVSRWRERIATEARDAVERQANMYSVNPTYIPRNHRVEEAIVAATDQQDFGPFHTLVDTLSHPYDYDPARERYATPPRLDQVVRKTFCGT
ncbi:MAG: protein adenylyltransferase SelO [Pseudomonadales bacterium]